MCIATLPAYVLPVTLNSGISVLRDSGFAGVNMARPRTRSSHHDVMQSWAQGHSCVRLTVVNSALLCLISLSALAGVRTVKPCHSFDLHCVKGMTRPAGWSTLWPRWCCRNW